MDRPLHRHEYFTINISWWGLSAATGIITPVLLPTLVALFVPWDQKNTYLAAIRVTSLAIAMAIQPMAGLLSDRSTLRWGRRRPYITAGTLLSLLFLLVIGASSCFRGSTLGWLPEPLSGVSAAVAMLLVGMGLWQAAANVAQGALQGLIPDLVRESQRGRASGVKAVMEMLAALPLLFVGRLVDAGLIWLTIGLVAMFVTVPWLITILTVREQVLEARPPGRIGALLLRLIGLTSLFVVITQAASWAVRFGATGLTHGQPDIGWRLAAAGFIGLVGMAGAIVAGVRLGTRVGIGRDAQRQGPFVWWVTNRLLFLAALGSIQGFALYFLSDVHHLPNPAAATTLLAAAVAACVIPSALASGALADRIGRKPLLVLAGLVAAAGTFLLILAPGLPWIVVSACVLGVATGTFMATSWAMGSDLVPRQEAGRYLGISNLAGAGAGIVGVGIGGPLADLVNALQPGLGYLTVFSIYGALFLLSAAALVPVKE